MAAATAATAMAARDVPSAATVPDVPGAAWGAAAVGTGGAVGSGDSGLHQLSVAVMLRAVLVLPMRRVAQQYSVEDLIEELEHKQCNAMAWRPVELRCRCHAV